MKSVRAKIGRAQGYLAQVKSALNATLSTESKIEPIPFNTHRQRHNQILIALSNFGPIGTDFPLIVGDCVHNMRSALDHLVYQLAILNHAPPEAAEKTMFPVCLTKEGNGFDSIVKRKVAPFVSSAALAELERCQPYKAYDVPEESDIWVLHKLDIIDKHRLLIIAREHYAVTWFRVTLPNGSVSEKAIPDPKWKPFEGGADIIRFDLSSAIPTPSPGEVKVEMQAAKSVQFADTGLACDGMFVQDALTHCLGLVKAIVRDFGAQFFGE
ncbi:MAG TPA: hypothetical protein VGL22_04650 [Terracidiphilus sp.]